MEKRKIPPGKIRKLESIIRLIARGSSPGERNAARHAAESILKKYGWTLKEYVDLVNARNRGTRAQPIEDAQRGERVYWDQDDLEERIAELRRQQALQEAEIQHKIDELQKKLAESIVRAGTGCLANLFWLIFWPAIILWFLSTIL